MKTLNIQKRRNIINFDETEIQIECMKNQKILISSDIKKFYAVSPENKKSIIVFEVINVVEHYSPLFLIIIQNQELMTSWFCEKRPAGIRILTSNSGFTNNQIGIEFLKHFIENSDAGPDADWKLMLMDNHESHCIHEFVTLANDNHIRPYSLIFHLTHCMQPLNVGVFQTYKHWHKIAIRQTISTSFVKYTVPQFLRDFSKIQNNAFKSTTIRNAFKNSGM